MTKIMLVEDDKSLREIYGVRLLAEGYDIVSAGDGEEALAMAIKERPQLIVSDVMMPKISGFDMLDILRSTTETKEIKVIMMTALSSEEQRTRGESLGADRYLVKSQVGIEDVVRVVHEVLGDNGGAQPAAATPPAPAGTPAPAPAATPAPAPTPAPAAAPAAPADHAAPATIPTPMHPQPAAPQTSPAVQPPSSAPKPPSLRSRIIQPLNDPTQSSVDMDALLNKELEKEASGTPEAISVEQESALIDEQLAGFAPTQAPAAPAAATTATPDALPTPQAVPTPDTAPAAQDAAAPQQPAASPTPTASPSPSPSNNASSNNDNVPGINIGPDGSVTPETEDAAPAPTPPTPAASATPPTTPQQSAS